MTKDASLRLKFFSQTLILFLGLLTIATVDPKFCSGESGFHCMESEQQALLKFKQDLKDPSNRLAFWVGVETVVNGWELFATTLLAMSKNYISKAFLQLWMKNIIITKINFIIKLIGG